VQLVSYAFTLEANTRTADLQVVTERCTQALGVAPDELSFFELQPLGQSKGPAVPRCIGVAVNKSGEPPGVACTFPPWLSQHTVVMP
jgi:hypothetical protein